MSEDEDASDKTAAWREWRLLVLDDLALNERHVESWIFGEDLRPSAFIVFQGSPPIRSRAPWHASWQWHRSKSMRTPS